MDIKVFSTVFITVFLAELGDKTQIATVLYATKSQTSKFLVFGAAASALIVATALAVLIGDFAGDYLDERYLRWIAGVAFIGVGLWVIAYP